MHPRIGIVLGDPCGIGPELVAKLLSSSEITERARIAVFGDRWLLRQGEEIAGVSLSLPVQDYAAPMAGAGDLVFLEVSSIQPDQVRLGQAMASAGRAVLETLRIALREACAGRIDAICFAPLNKQAMHLGGSPFDDELHFFAQELSHDGPIGELNVLDELWTSRVTSHVPLAQVCALITADQVLQAIALAHGSLGAAGFPQPRIAVAGLNPHAGDGGIFGREEIDIIAPAVQRARERGMDVSGPFPADTIFLRARDGHCDAVVTMYHDQGQIAMKLLGFERGVTVQGGLPIPITTPAHGTAFDIAGRGTANVQAMRQAFLIACTLGASHRQARARVDAAV